jgi:hypothetical protein
MEVLLHAGTKVLGWRTKEMLERHPNLRAKSSVSVSKHRWFMIVDVSKFGAIERVPGAACEAQIIHKSARQTLGRGMVKRAKCRSRSSRFRYFAWT